MGSLTLKAFSLVCLALPLAVQAADESQGVSATRAWVDEQLAAHQAKSEMPLRMEVIMGALDPRLQLAPCAKVETFLPAGTKLWGRSRVGIRCADGVSRWQVFLPIRIKAIGPAWVLRSAVPANTVLSEQDAVLKDVDWADIPSPVLARTADWVGKSLARTGVAGEAISAAMVRGTPAFATGALVKLIAQGPGFTIASAGHALGPGVLGQDVRVRLESGRIVSGKVNMDGAVTIGL